MRRSGSGGGAGCWPERQQPVQTLGAHGSDEALGEPVRLRRPRRRLHDPDALITEELVEGSAVLAVAIADQEADALLREIEAHVARVLRDPGAGRLGRAAGEPDAPAAVGDEEQGVV